MENSLAQALPALAGSISRDGAAADLLRALTEHTPVGVFLSDIAGGCRFVNRRWCELTGLSVDEALGDGWSVAIHPDDRERVAAEWADAATTARDSIISYRFRRPDGTVTWIDGYASAFRDANGTLVGWVGACLDVTSHRRAEIELQTQAQTDSLTGLLNRRAFDELLELALADASSSGQHLSLILLDIDHFKGINDTFGHQAGDDALVAVARCLRRSIRRQDLAARFGGDEFAVLARTAEPEKLAAHLLAAVRTFELKADGSCFRLTMSAGSAHADAPLMTPERLFAAADAALYAAKRRGRDRSEACEAVAAA